jgi:hypothetical protein
VFSIYFAISNFSRITYSGTLPQLKSIITYRFKNP